MTELSRGENQKKEYMPLLVFCVDSGEKEWVVARSKQDVLEYYRKHITDDIRLEYIKIQRLDGYFRESIGLEEFERLLAIDRRKIEVKADKVNGQFCSVKTYFREALEKIQNDESFEPFIICSTAH